MNAIYRWLQGNGFICRVLCVLATFFFSLFKRKKRKEERPSQNVSNIHNSSVNQAAGDITINNK